MSSRRVAKVRGTANPKASHSSFGFKGEGKGGGKPFGGKGEGVYALEHNEWDNEQWNNEQWVNEYQNEYAQPPVIALCAVEKKGPSIEQTANLGNEI